MRVIRTAMALAMATWLSGCAAANLAMSKANLDVQTKMSATVFLDPVPPRQRVVYLQVRNTSDRADFDIAQPIRDAIQAKGYTVTDDPGAAYLMLQANVRQVGMTSISAAQQALMGGYSDVALGSAVGASMMHAMAGGYGAGMAGGVLGIAITTIANATTKDVTFSIVTDLQISERPKRGVKVREDNLQALKQGTSGHKVQTSTETADWKRYQTRIVSTANKVNLEYEEAAPALVDGLVRSISGIL